jgi:hypothetical protein
MPEEVLKLFLDSLQPSFLFRVFEDVLVSLGSERNGW